jgi:hypothetical protein
VETPEKYLLIYVNGSSSQVMENPKSIETQSHPPNIKHPQEIIV